VETCLLNFQWNFFSSDCTKSTLKLKLQIFIKIDVYVFFPKKIVRKNLKKLENFEKNLFGAVIMSQTWIKKPLSTPLSDCVIRNHTSTEKSLTLVWFLDIKGVGVAFWYLSITPQNKSRAVVKNLRILVCRSILHLTSTYVKVNIVTSHHQVVSLF
jgi:hypothetical protein